MPTTHHGLAGGELAGGGGDYLLRTHLTLISKVGIISEVSEIFNFKKDLKKDLKILFPPLISMSRGSYQH